MKEIEALLRVGLSKNLFISRKFASKPTGKLKDQPSYVMGREIQRRLRDKTLDAIAKSSTLLSDEVDENIEYHSERHSESSSAQTSYKPDSIFVSRYFRQNLNEFRGKYGDVIDKMQLLRPDESDVDVSNRNVARKANQKQASPSYPYGKTMPVQHKRSKNDVANDTSRKTVEKIDKDRLTDEKIDNDRSTIEKIDNDRSTNEKIDNDRSTNEKIENDRSTNEKIDNDRSTNKKIDNDRSTNEKIDNDRSTNEKIDNDRSTNKKIDNDRSINEKIDNYRLNRSKTIALDRGFYCVGDSFKDDYVLGTAMDLPQEKQFSLISPKKSINAVDKGSKVKPQTFFKRIGPSDAVEEIEFQLPHQDIKPTTHVESGNEDDWRLRYGVEDPNVAPAPPEKTCAGCGARFHCQNIGLPGFLPVEYFLECSSNNFKPIRVNSTKSEPIVCRRCYLLKNYDFLLNVNVSRPNYELMLSNLRSKHEILVILIVDMLDFPCSIYRNLPQLIGVGKHVIVVGNKIDLIPPDSHADYLKHYRKCLRQAIVNYGFDKQLNIASVQLISAKTGFGVEELISRIYDKWAYRGDIYLVGCTNSGKSTLFNALLQSDLCKIRATDLIERATASIWPGTTLNLLKFPVMNPTAARMIQRRQRLRHVDKLVEKEEQHRRLLYERTGDKNYAVLQGYIGQTFADPEGISKDAMFQLQEAMKKPGNMHFMPNPYTSVKLEKLDIKTSPEFAYGNWCYDTPGTVNQDQIINILTLEELVKAVPGSLLKARRLRFAKNQSILVGGLVRIDFLENNRHCSSVSINLFCSDKLPSFVLDTWEVSKFYSKYVGTAVLEVPHGDRRRLADFPQLRHTVVELEGVGPKEVCADVVLSSVGWAAVSCISRIRLKIWTPNGVGVHVRQPPMIRSLDEN